MIILLYAEDVFLKNPNLVIVIEIGQWWQTTLIPTLERCVNRSLVSYAVFWQLISSHIEVRIIPAVVEVRAL